MQCSDRDLVGGWCDSGSLFVADVCRKNKLHAEDIDSSNGNALLIS